MKSSRKVQKNKIVVQTMEPKNVTWHHLIKVPFRCGIEKVSFDTII